MTGFEAIYEEYFIHVYRYIYSMCENENLAEEISQETFYKALEHMDQFDGKSRLYVWLCSIAKNTYFTYLKKHKRCVLEEEPDVRLLAASNIEDDLLDKDTAQRIRKLLHHLPEPYKEVFSLRVFGELPFSQIGDLFEKTDRWARVIYYRAKKEIRRGLNEESM